MNPTTKPTPDPRRRVDRGGGWSSNVPWWVRAASRNSNVPANREFNTGFRCALRGKEPRV